MMKRLDPLKSSSMQLDYRRLSFAILLWTLFVIASACGIASDQTVDSARQELINDWDRKFTRVETARVDFHQLFLMRAELNPYSRTKLIELVERHRDFSDMYNRQVIANALCSNRIKEDQRVWFLQHALKRKNDIFLTGRGSYRSRVNSFDVSRTNEQVLVYNNGALKLHVYTIDKLRQEMTKGFVENAEWEHISDSRFKLTYRSKEFNTSLEMQLDATTGFIYSWRNSTYEGILLDETQQYEPLVFGDGIVYPRMRVHCEYDHGNVTLFDATMLDNAAFNQQIADEEFRVPVPTGFTVADRRGGMHKAYKAEHDYLDALDALSHLESNQ